MDKILRCKNIEEAKQELKKINASSQGVSVMAPKFMHFALKLEKMNVGAANILKQEMLRIGGDAAISRGVVEGEIKNSDVILLGALSKIETLVSRLKFYQIFDLPVIRKRILRCLEISPEKLSLTVANQVISLSAPKIMGILNVTEDSFYDGGLYNSTENAVLQAKKMLEDGADFIDIGGESTRPGAQPIDSKTECERVIPIIREIRKWSKIPISIDTSKAEVAGKAIEAGADIINDISALRFDDKMLEVLQKNPHVPVILMHMQGTPQTMQEAPFYNDTIDEIISFFEERISFCEKNGVNRERIILDPGIGFGKRQKDNLLILKKLADFHIFQLPVLLGTSRKSFINGIYPSPAQNRLEGSLATTALAYQNHVQIIRVHDVLEHKRMIQTLQAIDEVL